MLLTSNPYDFAIRFAITFFSEIGSFFKALSRAHLPSIYDLEKFESFPNHCFICLSLSVFYLIKSQANDLMLKHRVINIKINFIINKFYSKIFTNKIYN